MTSIMTKGSPPGTTTNPNSVFRRSPYELAEEVADLLFWGSIIFAATRAGAALVGAAWPYFFNVVTFYFILALFLDYLQWDREYFEFIYTDNKTFLMKHYGVLRTNIVEEDAGKLTIRARQSPIERVLRIEKVELVGPSHVFIGSRRMPLRFRATIEQAQRGIKQAKSKWPADTSAMGQILALRDVSDWLGDSHTKQKAMSLLEQL
jgi:hypothetical protein